MGLKQLLTPLMTPPPGKDLNTILRKMRLALALIREGDGMGALRATDTVRTLLEAELAKLTATPEAPKP